MLQGVNPGITYTIAELLLLTPGNFGGQHVGKGLANNFFLHRLTWTHLGLRIGAHGDIEKLFVEEWHTTLYAPSRQALVGTQTVVEVEFA